MDYVNHFLMRLWLRGFGVVDVCLAVLVLWGIYRGLRNGLAGECGFFLELYTVCVLGFHYSFAAADWLAAKLQMPLFFTHGILFFVMAIACIVIMKLALRILGQVVTVQFSALLERVGGGFLGVARYTLFLGLILHTLLLFHIPNMKESVLERSKTGRYVVQFPHALHQRTVIFINQILLARQIVP